VVKLTTNCVDEGVILVIVGALGIVDELPDDCNVINWLIHDEGFPERSLQ